jgi:hypothetical protein
MPETLSFGEAKVVATQQRQEELQALKREKQKKKEKRKRLTQRYQEWSKLKKQKENPHHESGAVNATSEGPLLPKELLQQVALRELREKKTDDRESKSEKRAQWPSKNARKGRIFNTKKSAQHPKQIVHSPGIAVKYMESTLSSWSNGKMTH